jgi:hypothetical protein
MMPITRPQSTQLKMTPSMIYPSSLRENGEFLPTPALGGDRLPGKTAVPSGELG